MALFNYLDIPQMPHPITAKYPGQLTLADLELPSRTDVQDNTAVRTLPRGVDPQPVAPTPVAAQDSTKELLTGEETLPSKPSPKKQLETSQKKSPAAKAAQAVTKQPPGAVTPAGVADPEAVIEGSEQKDIQKKADDIHEASLSTEHSLADNLAGKPDRETLLSRFLRPQAGEGEATKRGQRWAYQLQNSWMLPGSSWAEAVRKNAAAEAQSFSAAQKDKGIVTPLAIERQKRRIIQEVKDLTQMYIKQNLASPDGLGDWGREEYLKKYKEFEEYWREITASEERPQGEPFPLEAQNNWNMAVNANKQVSDLRFAMDQDLTDAKMIAEAVGPTGKSMLQEFGMSIMAKAANDPKNMADTERVRLLARMGGSAFTDAIAKNLDAYHTALVNVQNLALTPAAQQHAQSLAYSLDQALKSKDPTTILVSFAEVLSGIQNKPELAPMAELLDQQWKSLMQTLQLTVQPDKNVLLDILKHDFDRNKAKLDSQTQAVNLPPSNKVWTVPEIKYDEYVKEGGMAAFNTKEFVVASPKITAGGTTEDYRGRRGIKTEKPAPTGKPAPAGGLKTNKGWRGL